MNEQVQVVLSQLLKRAGESVDSIVAFGKEQIPQVVVEYLEYHFIISVISVVLPVILFFVSVFFIKRVWRKLNTARAQAVKDYADNKPWTRSGVCSSATSFQYDSIMYMIPILIVIAVVVYFCIFTSVTLSVVNFDFVKIYFAPRVYLIDEGVRMAKMVRGA